MQGPDLVAAIWMLRLLLRNNSRFPAYRHEFDDDMAKVVGVRNVASASAGTIHKRLAARLVELEAVDLRRGAGLLRNAALLARMLHLTPIERELVVLAVVIGNVEEFGNLFCGLGLDPISELSRRVACALAVDARDVKRALRKDGALRTTKLLDVSKRHHHSEVAITAPDDVAEALMSTHLSAQGLMRRFLRESPPTLLALTDFAHVETDASSLVRLMKGALRRRAKGVNVLLHGKPGTGKTELARVVARAVGAQLYEVADSDAGGDPIEGTRRLGMCAIAHRLLAQTQPVLLLFDEIEDAFPSRWHGALGLERGSTPTKSWTHRLLERAPVPTFWVANEIEQIDPATLRRFDLVIELGVPPSAVRRRMITTELRTATLEGAQLDRLAADERLAPAHLSRAVRVTGLMGAGRSKDLGSMLAHVLERNLATQGPARPVLSSGPSCGPYDLAFVNASVDLGGVAGSLARATQASICLYGPPGTGKTAWVAHLAASLGRPLRAARASDLLDCWVGGTERNIAALFRSAFAEKALLFLDEADSFLQERGRAKHSWEVTQVNELLVQMEAFQGIFVCATNLVDALDEASLRRFALKVEFLPLRPEQRWAMFQRLAGKAGDAVPRTALERLHGLTAGDFATVTRQVRLVGGEAQPEELVAMLEREIVLRKGRSVRSIGFGRWPAEKGGGA